MQQYSPFEPGYVGNHDPGGMVGVLDVTFPRDLLLGAGADEALVDRITAELDDAGPDERRRVIELFEAATPEQLVEVLAAAQDRFDGEDAYAALPEEDRAALEALSDEDREALAGLTVTPEPTTDEVPKGTVDEVLAWVGDDVERAALALAVEEQTSDPRVTLVKPLQDLLTAPADGPQ